MSYFSLTEAAPVSSMWRDVTYIAYLSALEVGYSVCRFIFPCISSRKLTQTHTHTHTHTPALDMYAVGAQSILVLLTVLIATVGCVPDDIGSCNAATVLSPTTIVSRDDRYKYRSYSLHNSARTTPALASVDVFFKILQQFDDRPSFHILAFRNG